MTDEQAEPDGLITEAEADLSHRVGQHMMRASIPFVALYGAEQLEMLQYIRYVDSGKLERLRDGLFKKIAA